MYKTAFKAYRLFLLWSALVFFPSYASACCSVTTGLVNTIGYLPNGIFFFSFDTTTNFPGSCNTQRRFALNVAIPSQKTLMGIVLFAKSTDTRLQIVGMQTCNNWPDSEDVGALTSMAP